MSMRSFLIFGMLIGLLSFTFYPVKSTEAALGCSFDYYGFVVKARSESTRRETLSDFLSMGYCQLNDILQLEDELESIRTNFRNAAEACQGTDIYKQQYIETIMQEYFVRNIQKKDAAILDETDKDRLEALKQVRLDKLRKEMKEQFVVKEGRVSETVFDTYFDNWSVQYKDRIGEYAHCEEGPWAELQDTLNDFIEDINSLSVAVDPPHKESTDAKEKGFIKRTLQEAWEFFKGEQEQREAEVESQKTVKDISEGDEVVTFEQALESLNDSRDTTFIQTNAASRMARYSVLYGSGAAQSATDMQSTLVYINQVLVESNTKDFPNLNSGAEKIYDRQCQ